MIRVLIFWDTLVSGSESCWTKLYSVRVARGRVKIKNVQIRKVVRGT